MYPGVDRQFSTDKKLKKHNQNTMSIMFSCHSQIFVDICMTYRLRSHIKFKTVSKNKKEKQPKAHLYWKVYFVIWRNRTNIWHFLVRKLWLKNVLYHREVARQPAEKCTWCVVRFGRQSLSSYRARLNVLLLFPCKAWKLVACPFTITIHEIKEWYQTLHLNLGKRTNKGASLNYTLNWWLSECY